MPQCPMMSRLGSPGATASEPARAAHLVPLHVQRGDGDVGRCEQVSPRLALQGCEPEAREHLRLDLRDEHFRVRGDLRQVIPEPNVCQEWRVSPKSIFCRYRYNVAGSVVRWRGWSRSLVPAMPMRAAAPWLAARRRHGTESRRSILSPTRVSMLGWPITSRPITPASSRRRPPWWPWWWARRRRPWIAWPSQHCNYRGLSKPVSKHVHCNCVKNAVHRHRSLMRKVCDTAV